MSRIWRALRCKRATHMARRQDARVPRRLASCLRDILGWERESCCKLHKPFELWPLVSKWSYSQSLWQNRGLLLTERGTVLISSSLWESSGTVIDLTTFELDAMLPLWRRQEEEGRRLNKLLCDTPASWGRRLQVSGAWWIFGVLNWDRKGDPERCSVCASDETKKPLRGFVNWNGKICVF